MTPIKNESKLNKNGNRRGMHRHPNSLKNLEKRNNKGNSHAKKDCSITRILKDMANDPAPERWLEVEDKGKGLTYRQAAARRIWLDAIRGNAKITSELLDRVDGKVTQPIGGEGGEPIKTEIIVSSDTAKNLTKAILNGKGT